MRKSKEIFILLLAIQVCSVTWAKPYGHPDAETIDIHHRTLSQQPSRDQFIIEAAIRRGMDGEAVAELLRTKQPVVKVKAEPNGVTKTTTYKLDPDGSISSKTITEVKSVRHFEADSLPDSVAIDDILKSPTGTVTRTFTDKDGATVTQTFGVSKAKPTSIFESDNNDDWFRRHRPTWSGVHETPLTVQRTPVRTWSSQPEEAPPSTNYHKTITTYTGPNGDKRVVESWSSDPEISPKEKKFPSAKWPTFDFPEFSQPWQPTDTMGDPDEWTVVKDNPDVETTTKRKFQSWTPQTWHFPDFPAFETTTTARPPKVPPMQPKVTTPLPSLDDFLKNQYGHTTTMTKTATTTPRPKARPTETTTITPVTIKIEDLPVTQILHNGEPADESIIKMLPPHLTPILSTPNVLKIENKHPIEAEPPLPKKVETNIRKITKTHIGPAKPTLMDLDPQMQEILRNAGISPDDITNIEGDTITKTRTEPDGRVITTTYKIRTSAPASTDYEESRPTDFSTFYQHKPLEIPNIPHLTPKTSIIPIKPSPISEFLAKLGLTKSDILSKNGEYTRTIIDDDGQVLTATFILSTPISPAKAAQTDSTPKKKPFK